MSYSDDGNGYFTRALDAEDRGELSQAETAYRQAIELFKETQQTQRELAACHYNLGHLYVVMNVRDKAITEYQRCLEYFGQITDSSKPKGRAHLILGSLFVEDRDYPALSPTYWTPWGSTWTRRTSPRIKRSATSTWRASTTPPSAGPSPSPRTTARWISIRQPLIPSVTSPIATPS